MGSNPLLLALLIGVFLRGEQRLPELRTQLYNTGVQLLLRRVEVGDSGKRNPKALAAVLKNKPQRKARRSRRQAAPVEVPQCASRCRLYRGLAGLGHDAP